MTESTQGTDSYILGDGMPAPIWPPVPVAEQEDVHFPPEEPAEATGAAAPAVLSASAEGGWAVLASPGSGGGGSANVSVGASVFGFELMAVLDAGAGVTLAVLERGFARWGFIAYVSSAGGEVARLRKGVGSPSSLVMPAYKALVDNDCTYYATVAGEANDWLGSRILNDTAGEPSFSAAAKYLPPQRDYASIGAIDPYQKYSVSPDGRIKRADAAIYTTAVTANATGPGTLVFDPARALPAGLWPETNFSQLQSGLVGVFLRVVAVVGYEPTTGAGFELVAMAPASEPAASAYVRLRAFDGALAPPAYFNASVDIPGVLGAPLTATAFYAALLAEQSAWNATLAPAASFSLPGREGARQAATASGALVASLSLFVGLQPNYGDGEDYWSPQVDRGGSLPFQTIALDQNLLDVGLVNMAADRVGWWFDHYIVQTGPNRGAVSTGDWEDSCPDGFADGLADEGEMQDLFVRTAVMQLGYNKANGSAWLAAHIDNAVLLANYSLQRRLAAVANASLVPPAARGLIFGSPEHDTCHSPDYYYHNNAWFIRGMRQMGRFLSVVCASLCPAYAPLGDVLIAEGARFTADLEASLALTVTLDNATGAPFFIPPIARAGFAPFKSMLESTLAEYSNFRYYSELLGSDVLSPTLRDALQDFRESTFGTVSGITRWSDHLDDMPSSYYLAASLWSDRIPRFLLLQYGHMANYQGRGTFTATEQLPISADSLGFYRDYLWSYLEGGIDQCIPSIMLPAIGTRWQLVLERYDEDALYLARGAPSRWAAPGGGGYGVSRAATRFGVIDLHVDNVARAAGDGEDARAAVTFTRTPVAVPGLTPAPQLRLLLRSSAPEDILQPATVAITGAGVVVAGVDGNTVLVNITSPPAPGAAVSFTVTASLTH